MSNQIKVTAFIDAIYDEQDLKEVQLPNESLEETAKRIFQEELNELDVEIDYSFKVEVK